MTKFTLKEKHKTDAEDRLKPAKSLEKIRMLSEDHK